MSRIEAQAHAIVARVDVQKVGLAIPIIFELLKAVLPVIMTCFSKTDGAMDEMAITDQLRITNEKNPERLLRRTAREIRFQADEPMTKAASFELARATIEQALSVDDSEAASCCSEAGI